MNSPPAWSNYVKMVWKHHGFFGSHLYFNQVWQLQSTSVISQHEKKALQRDEDNCAVKMCDGGIEDI